MASEQAKDLAAGTMAGLTSKIIEYPFDTVKVRLQTSNRYSGMLNCFQDMVAKEGPKSLFRGVGAPIVGAMLENSLMFWGYGLSARWLGGKENLGLGGITLCGGFSGIGVSLWLTPVEYLKCRLQASHTAKLYSGIMSCLRHTVQTEGWMALTTGLQATVLREVPGGAVYWLAYEVLSRSLTPEGQKASTAAVLAGGSAAGVAYWTAIMPFDVIKSRMQTAVSGAGAKAPGVMATARSIFATGGLSGFYAGLMVTAPRAMLSNAIIFGTYDYFKNALDGIM